jgi:hypothetical protein
MKVDGGKCLTYSGWVSWYGQDQMDRRFEATSTSKYGYMLTSIKKKISNRANSLTPGSSEWVKEIQTSNWSTHLEEAHQKVQESYGKVDNDKLNEYADTMEGANFQPKAAQKVNRA